MRWFRQCYRHKDAFWSVQNSHNRLESCWELCEATDAAQPLDDINTVRWYHLPVTGKQVNTKEEGNSRVSYCSVWSNTPLPLEVSMKCLHTVLSLCDIEFVSAVTTLCCLPIVRGLNCGPVCWLSKQTGILPETWVGGSISLHSHIMTRWHDTLRVRYLCDTVCN